jgi:hypothetical protein
VSRVNNAVYMELVYNIVAEKVKLWFTEYFFYSNMHNKRN